MKRFILTFIVILGATSGAMADFSCGPGYILTSRAKIDGIDAQECTKLWCMDLETGKPMGKNNTANNGYRLTSGPVELCDNEHNCIECFGERKWCGGEMAGVWNPEYGAYTRTANSPTGDVKRDINTTYQSYQKSGCFGWRLKRPECENGQTAILVNGIWECGTNSGSGTATRASSVRRTGTIRIRR